MRHLRHVCQSRHWRHFALPSALVLGLAACSQEPESLTFNPEVDDVRSYRVLAETYMEADSGFGRSTDRVYSEMITDYRVSDAGEKLKLDILPTYLRLKYRNGDFASSDTPTHYDQEVRTFMREGFALLLDDKRQVKQFVVNADAIDNDTNQHEMLMDMFNDGFSRPGIAHGIALLEGATQTIESDNEIPDVVLTVVRVDGDTAHLTVQGESEYIKIFGVFIVDRYSGWLERGSIITTIEEHDSDSSISIRSTMSMFPADWPYDVDTDFLSDSSGIEMPAFEGFSRVPESPSEDDVFAQGEGYIDEFSSDLYLVYEHTDADIDSVGYITIDEAKAYTINGDPLDLSIQLQRAASYEVDANGEVYTMAGITPLGWENTHQQMKQLGYVEALVHWHPYRDEIVTLEVGNDSTSVEVGDAKATLSPTDEEDVYALVFEQGERTYFNFAIGTSVPVYRSYKSYEDAPEWLDLGDQRLLAITEFGRYPGYYYLYFGDEKPSSIELQAFSTAAEPTTQRSIRFYHPDAMESNPRAAVPQRSPLYPTASEMADSYYRSLGVDDRVFEPNPTDAIDFEAFSDSRAYLTLTPEQAGLCEITQNSDDIELQEAPEPTGLRLPNNRMNNPVVLQAKSPDGEREHFYDERLTVTMSCPVAYEWQPLELEESEHSWMIDIEQLPGIDASTPMPTLLRTYAFLTASDVAPTLNSEDIHRMSVGVVAPERDTDQRSYNRHPYFSAEVGDYLYENRYLRVAGNVSQVFQLVPSDDIKNIELSYTFPSSPDLSTTFAEMNQAEESH